MMQVYKLEATRDPEWIGTRQGYALATTHTEALAICSATANDLPLHRVYELHVNKQWPGGQDEVVSWNSR